MTHHSLIDCFVSSAILFIIILLDLLHSLLPLPKNNHRKEGGSTKMEMSDMARLTAWREEYDHPFQSAEARQMQASPDPEYFALASAKAKEKGKLYQNAFMPWVGW